MAVLMMVSGFVAGRRVPDWDRVVINQWAVWGDGVGSRKKKCKSLESDSSLEAITGRDKATKLWRDNSRT